MKYLLKDKRGKIVCGNLDTKCVACYESPREHCSECIKCPMDARSCRISHRASQAGEAFLCSDEKKHLKSKRMFGTTLSLYLDMLQNISMIRDDVTMDNNRQNKRIIHNLVSLNAKNMQEVFDLVPQDVLTGTYGDQMRLAKKYIEEHPVKAAKLFMRIAKHNSAMKVEFSVFQKLMKTSPDMKFEVHSIHKVLLNVLYTFFPDFTESNVLVNVSKCTHQLRIDYESFYVAFYHILDNTSKYIQPDSELDISFPLDAEWFSIVFDMMSLKVGEEEVDDIFSEGYSGSEAQSVDKAGDGIGLFVVKQVLSLNDSQVVFRNNIHGGAAVRLNSSEYEHNQIVVKVPRRHLALSHNTVPAH